MITADKLDEGFRPATAEQTLILMTSDPPATAPRAQCPGGLSLDNEIRWTFIVLPDLSGPDPRVTQRLAYTLRQLEFQRDKLVDGEVSVLKNDVNTGLQGGVCGLNFKRPSFASKDR